MVERDGIKTYRVLSLGAGVQSTALALMIEQGELAPVDVAIFADTGWEPTAVYKHLEWLRSEVKSFPIEVLKTTSLRDDTIRRKEKSDKSKNKFRRAASLPFYTRNPQTGSRGILRRQCTESYKITPIERYIRSEMMGLSKGQRFPKNVVIKTLIGISSDEASRMKPSKNHWQEMIYPLCDTPVGSGRVTSRQDCLSWLKANYPNINPVKSACIGCPYHSDNEWRDMKLNRPDEFADAVDFDKRIRQIPGVNDQAYLHRSGRPLDEVDLESLEDKGQMTFFDEQGNICDGGTCFL